MLYYLDNWRSAADSGQPTLAARAPGRAAVGLAAGRDGTAAGAGPAAMLALIPDSVYSVDALPPRARARLGALPDAARELVSRYLAPSRPTAARVCARRSLSSRAPAAG
jgi:hypothetical protein